MFLTSILSVDRFLYDDLLKDSLMLINEQQLVKKPFAEPLIQLIILY